MKTISLIGAFLVTLALLSYGIGSISLQRFKEISKGVLGFLVAGVILDVSATICMIIGSLNTPFTIHGFVGYSALLVMLIDVFLLFKEYLKNGWDAKVSRKLHFFSKLAYVWWVIAYLTGSLLIILK